VTSWSGNARTNLLARDNQQSNDQEQALDSGCTENYVKNKVYLEEVCTKHSYIART